MSLNGLVAATEQVFAPDGALANNNPNYCQRSGQLQMACAVANAIEQGEPLVVEAGTGVGKTFAYLVPALLSGARTIVSTATKNLQDQLFTRDLPYLVDLLGIPVKLALLKGRASYVCLHRLEQACQTLTRSDGYVFHTVHKVAEFAARSDNGDLSEMVGLDERSQAIPLVTSTRENCLGSKCPVAKLCHVNKARREALNADVVVVNHHLFFADMVVRENGVGELLPTAHTVVFDEAHQLNETGTQFLGLQLGTSQLMEIAKDIKVNGILHAQGLADWRKAAGDIEQAAQEWRLVAGVKQFTERLRWLDEVPETLNPDEWPAALRKLTQALEQAWDMLEQVNEVHPDLERLQRRCDELREHIHTLRQPCPPDHVRWLEVGKTMRMVQSPLDIAKVVQERLLRIQPSAADASDIPVVPKAWIFTSATLGDKNGLQWFTEPCGLQNATTLQVHSPFDYARNAALYIPQDWPQPSGAAHVDALVDFVQHAAAQLGGRTLVLTTTTRNLQTIGQSLKQHFEHATPSLQVLVQGEGTKLQLIERFREGDANGKQAGCVLVASMSFWEGVDVPGNNLQLVVIDKLPFSPPDDPLVEARSTRLKEQGRSAFNDYALPEAAVMLKQGVGRLIRSEQDQGIVVIADVRMVQKYYGRRLLQSLPPMQRLYTHTDFANALQRLQVTHG